MVNVVLQFRWGIDFRGEIPTSMDIRLFEWPSLGARRHWEGTMEIEGGVEEQMQEANGDHFLIKEKKG